MSGEGPDKIQKSYLDTERGQIHLRSLAAAGDADRPDLLCLHPSPYSGAYYETVMPLLNNGRRIIAPDYPGYGNSYSLEDPPAIRDYAEAMLASVLATENDGPIDLLGFHSGCLVAAEIKLLAPDRVRQLLLIDVPYFDRDTQAQFAGKVAKPMPLSFKRDSLQQAWEFNVGTREGIVPLDRAFDMFVDQISSGVRDYFCFHAAFSYDCLGQFAKIEGKTTLIATQSPLLQATQAAAAAIGGATLIDEPSISTSVFEQGVEKIAAHILGVLDDE